MNIEKSGVDYITISMTRDEPKTIIHAMSEVTLTPVIAKGEFFARLGVTRDRADQILDDLSTIWKVSRGTSHPD
jgi:hypothetical protein